MEGAKEKRIFLTPCKPQGGMTIWVKSSIIVYIYIYCDIVLVVFSGKSVEKLLIDKITSQECSNQIKEHTVQQFTLL